MLGILLNERLRSASAEMLHMLSACIDINTLCVAVNDAKTNQIIKAYNRAESLVSEGAMPFLESYCSHVCNQVETEVLMIEDTTLCPLTSEMAVTCQLGPATFIGVPIVLKDGTKPGTVCAMDRQKHAFTDREIQLLQVAATFIGYVIELERAAYVDDATGAFTRKYLHEAFNEMAADAQSISLLFFDLDNFKLINDSQGHDFGDQVLRAAATRLQEFLEARGSLYRLGGDEFAILSKEPRDEHEVLLLARQVLDQFATPLRVGTRALVVTPSIGAAIYPDGGGDLGTLVRHADMAMYGAKRDGGNRVNCFRAIDEAAVQERLDLQERLRRAVVDGKLEVYYQPKVTVADGSIRSVEALARWRDESGQWIAPDRFIPIAEESALIGSIGTWILWAACRQQVAWEQAGCAPVVVSVNVSPKQFQLGSVAALVREVIAQTGIDPTRLAIEITEGLLVRNSMDVAEELRQIRSLGVKIAIDDFGKGYSSLSYLRLFEPTHLKIDKSFVDDMLEDESQMSIVAAIIHLAHNLGMGVVAEGVEHVEQYHRLRAEGCDLVQGYFISKPVPAHELEHMLTRSRSLPQVRRHVV